MTVQGVESAAAIFTALIFWNSNCRGCFSTAGRPFHIVKNVARLVCKLIAAKAKKRGLRVETHLRNEKINYKVREHSLAKIPALIAVGRKEASENIVSVRRLGSNAQSTMGTDEPIAALTKEAMPPNLRKAG
jgi:threonyl-tRNA synthetase